MSKAGAVGSFLKPEASVVNEFVAHLQEICRALLNGGHKDFVSAHNSMALYTMQMLSFVTGHRAVSDPFCYLSAFDLNNKLVLIEDKVVSSAHQARLTWLPPLAIVQLQNYIAHLSALARIVRQENPALANAIFSLTTPESSPSIPLFFHLYKVKNELCWGRYQPSSIQEALGSRWILPLNSNRHILSTWLRENNCPSEYVDAQLGHIEAGCSPFSARSVLEPNAVGQIVTPYLETYLEEHGWTAVVGLKAPSRLPLYNFEDELRHQMDTVPFGPEVRTINRQETWRKDIKAVLELIRSELGDASLTPQHSEPLTIPDTMVNRLQDRLMQDAPDGRVLIRLSFLRRHLIKLKRAGWQIKVPGRLVLGKWEGSCFHISSFKDACKIEDVQNKFIAYLSCRKDEIVGEEQRVAEILISAVLFGANTSIQFFNVLGVSFKDRIIRTKDQVYVDVASSINGPIHRWIPDALSLALILGYLRVTHKNSNIPSVENVGLYLQNILHDMGAPVARMSSKKQSISQLLEPLLKLAKYFWRLRLPGVLHAYAEGDTSCASVPLSNWIRLITGGVGATYSQQSNAASNKAPSKPYDDIFTIQQLGTAKVTYKQAKDCWSEITKILGTMTRSEKQDRGQVRSGNSEARSNARKKTIVSNVSEFLNDKSKNIPPIAALIAAWVNHLCCNGTSHSSTLRANSVTAYVRSIGDKLIALAYPHDFLSISDLLIEDVYRNVLETASNQNRSYVAARLKEFHSFLVSSYAMPDLDWSEVVSDDLLEADAVDAGIVMLAQYQKALETLSNFPDFSERDRLLHSIVLLLAYRFGLRTGEIFRLTISDIILHERDMVIYVRNSVYGETKTDNGIRQVPLIGDLSDLECGLISRWLIHIETYADDDSLATLLPKFSSRRDIVDRSSCVRTVVEVLRTVIGDTQIRLRHLRHTCATRLFLAMLFEDVPSGVVGNIYMALWGEVLPRNVRKILIGAPPVSRRGLYAMALYMGHASPDVTHRHYVHLADVVLNEWVRKCKVDIDDKALSYAYQTTYGNVRKLRSRCKAGFFQEYLTEHFTRLAEISNPVLRNDISEYSFVTNLRESGRSLITPVDIDRILAIATMRDSIDGVADRFLTTDQMIASTLLNAAIIQVQTGFSDFAVPDTRPEDNWIARKGLRYELLEKESARVRKFLIKSDLGMRNAEQLKVASDIWIDAYHPHSTSLLISKRSELTGLLDALKVLGIRDKDFEVIIPIDEEKNESGKWTEIEAELLSAGMRVHRQNRLPLSSSRYLSENRLGIILRASNSHSLGYQRTLNRALFITSVWLKLNSEYSGRV